MAYQVLARKWRPRKFADLVGQNHVADALLNAVRQNRLHHAYLLTGTRGVGKTTIARILAKSLNCENPDNGEPCGECAHCSQIDAGRFVDLLEIDAASNTGVDNILGVLENAQYAPTAGRYKVYIIDEVHMLSKSAFNAMLKTLEEPPAHVKFILATTDPHKVPVTVLSRCLQFVLRNLTVEQIGGRLLEILQAENIPFEPAALPILARAAAGSLRDALSLLDQSIALGSGSVSEENVRQMLGVADSRYLFALLAAIAAQDTAALWQNLHEMAARMISFDAVLGEMALLLQNTAMAQAVSQSLDDHPEKAEIAALAAQLSPEQIQLYYQCAVRGKADLPLAPDEYTGFSMTLLRMLAFAPLAAADVPADAQIRGTDLHNPAADTSASVKPSAAENPAQNAAAENLSAGLKSPAAENPAQNAAAENLSGSLKSSAAENPAQNTAAENLSAGLKPSAAENPAQNAAAENLSAGLKSPAAENPAQNAVSDNLSASVQTAVAEGAAAEHLLPALVPDNWKDIVSSLDGELGPGCYSFVLDTALADVRDEGIFLAVHPRGKSRDTADNRRRISEVLARHYTGNTRLHVCPWQEEYRSVAERGQAEAEAQRRQNLADLAADPVAEKIRQTFGGQWQISDNPED